MPSYIPQVLFVATETSLKLPEGKQKKGFTEGYRGASQKSGTRMESGIKNGKDKKCQNSSFSAILRAYTLLLFLQFLHTHEGMEKFVFHI